jgi:hypothetical protein
MKYLLILFALTACTQRTLDKLNEASPHRFEASPHIFKNFSRLDTGTNAPTTYRVENDETICYIIKESGVAIWCYWKTKE